MILFGILVFLILIIAILITFAVLLQSGKGGGLSGIAAGSTQQILGSRQAPDALVKVTWWLGGALILLCVLSAVVLTRPADEARSVVQGATGTTQTDPAAAPAAPAEAPAPAPAE